MNKEDLKKEFLPYQESLELRELGFDKPCFGYYIELKNPTESILIIDKCENDVDGVLAPIFSQSFRFFREKYGLDGEVMLFMGNLYTWECYKIANKKQISVERITAHVSVESNSFSSYEEAELVCLQKLIQIVKDNVT